ncbi:hypothetical protein GRX01_03900 [Halobaculum sp. WSA2]|uniref:Uncharacterized protein n=1 Tax=Halobaculum saliterrae TaxID=2073113 RepID=A0A6B0SNL9_9EURY|nr:hypothetical protein [Halobaculum saliterrae]MXR40494.1 hypothetical protein [Halobaculum saliterrae]
MTAATHPIDSCTVTPDSAPRGALPLVEPQAAHQAFLTNNPNVHSVVLKLPHVERLVNQGETADSYFPDSIAVITTSTCRDEYLSELTVQREAALIRAFDPTVHIPFDVPVYRSTSRVERRERIRQQLRGTARVATELADTDISLLPLIKGTCKEEWQIYHRFLQHNDIHVTAIYGTQYFSSGAGLRPLREDIMTIVSIMPDLEVILLGLLYPPYLEQLPPQVIAASGLHQWRTRCDLREGSIKQTHEEYGRLKSEVNATLGESQMPLSTWVEDTGVTA